VRDVAGCVAAADDLSTATALMEARLVAGDPAPFAALEAALAPPAVWPSRRFLEAKLAEQRARHARFHGTPYRLEPNVKDGPGGLRDLHVVDWVASRHHGTRGIDALAARGFLSGDEHRALDDARRFLTRTRFALHLAAGRREERLLFDLQIKLARQFGYADRPGQLAVEQFMQLYYRTVTELERLNEVLLGLIEQAVTPADDAGPVPVDARFQERGGFLEAIHPETFRRHPEALLEIFQALQQRPHLKGIGASTLRLIRRDRELIGDAYRAQSRHRRLFMDILREPRGVTHELRRMNRWGVLGRYIPEFGAVIGRMQFDLFHAYTVDEHTLFVVSNLRRFALPRYDHEFPRCSRLMQALPKPELVYLAGLFHDIAKGRGGDHSELGALDAERFCLDHGLSRFDARLVAWLVQHHLLLSVTAQKRDITDPEVIREFAATVGDELHLDCLYLLTVADVRGTNPELWNAWKARLFEDLYEQTQGALRRGLEAPIDLDERLAAIKANARAALAAQGYDGADLDAVWRRLSTEYFLRHSADEIAWHTSLLAEHDADAGAVVQLRQTPGAAGTAVLVYAPADDACFARATAAFDQLGLSVLDARIVGVAGDWTVQSYTVLEDTGAPIADAERVTHIQRVLAREVQRRFAPPLPVTRRAPRQVRMFATPTRVAFAPDARNGRTAMELVAGDRPGLLCEVGKAFQACGVRLRTAKITTVGERAEDVFFITDPAGRPFDDPEAQRTLAARLAATLDNART
jgi:[protein-PII] uridylyltransferase